MGKAKVYKWDIEIPLYYIQFHLYVPRFMSEACSAIEIEFPGIEMDDVTNVETGAFAGSFTHEEYGSEYVMIIPTHVLPEDRLPAVIAHESLHLSWFMADLIGLVYEWNNHEHQAYFMQWIMEETWDHVQKRLPAARKWKDLHKGVKPPVHASDMDIASSGKWTITESQAMSLKPRPGQAEAKLSLLG